MIHSIKSGHTNCFLLKDETTQKAVLIDAGSAADKGFIERLNAAGWTEQIGLLILTHGHFDHVGHAAMLQGHYGIKVAIHQSDAEGVKQGRMDFSPAESLLGGIIRSASARGMEKARYSPFTPDIIIGDEEPLPGFEMFRPVHLPGHTAGSIGVLFDGCLFAGDLVMNMPFPSPCLFADDFPMLKQSIERAKTLNPATVYPSHGMPFSGERFRRL